MIALPSFKLYIQFPNNYVRRLRSALVLTGSYVDQPGGFEIKSPTGEKLVCILNKSLYALKQSDCSWNGLSNILFLEIGFVHTSVDNRVYSKHVGYKVAIMLVWIDDIIVAASNDDELREVKDLRKKGLR
jgi:hypothetical protein